MLMVDILKIMRMYDFVKTHTLNNQIINHYSKSTIPNRRRNWRKL